MVQRVEAAARPPLTDGEFDRDALSALVDKISNASVIPRERGDTIAFRDINLRRTTDRGALLALLRAISDGQVAACSSSPPTALGDIEFDLASVTSYLKTERSPKSYTALEVAEITGWKHECVTHWCKIGLLKASLVPHGNAQAYQISPTALAEFQRRYLVISDLAQERASSSRHILHTLENRGIPVIGTKPTKSSRRCCLVSYSELLLI